MAVKILVVDDSATMRKIMEMTFAGEDAEVIAVDSGDAAMKKAAEIRPNIILADASLPSPDGYAIAQAVKSDPAIASTAVVVMSSQQAAYDEARGRAAGVDDHVVKPFDTQALIDKVADVLSRPRRSVSGAMAPAAPAPAAPVAPPAAPAAAAARPAVGLGAAPVRKPTVGFGPAAARPSTPEASLPEPSARSSRPSLELADDAPVTAPANAPAATRAMPSRPVQPSFTRTTQSLTSPSRPLGATPSPGPAVSKPAVTSPAAPARPAATSTAASTAASSAASSATTSAMTPKLQELGLSKEQIEAVLALSRQVVEQVVWEVVPDLAETLIKEEIKRLTAG